MKRIKSVLLGVVALGSILFTSCTYTNIGNGVSNIRYDNADKYVVGNQTYEVELKEVFIDWVSGDFTLEYTEETTISVSEEFVDKKEDEITDEIRLHTYLDGTKLMIEPSACGSYKFDFKKNLTIKLPKNTNLEKLDVDVVGGKLVSNVEVNDINIDSVSLDTYFALNTFNKIEIDTVSGELFLFVKSDILVFSDLDTVSGTKKNEIYTIEKNHVVDMDSVSAGYTIKAVEETYITSGNE